DDATPENGDGDAEEDERGEPEKDAGAGLAKPCDQPRRKAETQIHRAGDDRDADDVGDYVAARKQPSLVAGAQRDGYRDRPGTDGQRKRQRIKAAASDLSLAP